MVTVTDHRIRWFVWAGGQKMPHTAMMAGFWGYDAECSCGWKTRTGGAVRRHVEELVEDHKFEFALQVRGERIYRGDRIFRWWDAGCSMDVQPLTVVRVNPTTVTVRTDQGSTFRLPHADIVGHYTEENAS
jgi:hypothetical protein